MARMQKNCRRKTLLRRQISVGRALQRRCFFKKQISDKTLGIATHNAIIAIETASAFAIARLAARFSSAQGSESAPIARCAAFQVSSSCSVQGRRRPVCRLYGSFGAIKPPNSMTALVIAAASHFSLFSDISISDCRRTTTAAATARTPRSNSVVRRSSPRFCSAVETASAARDGRTERPGTRPCSQR